LEQFTEILSTSTDNENSTVLACIQMTVRNCLNEEETFRFKDLVIFPEDIWIHQNVFLLLWCPELPKVAPGRRDSVCSVLESLVNFSLLDMKNESGVYYRAHDLVLNYLQQLVAKEDQQQIHQKLLNKYTTNLKYPPHLWSGPLDPGCYLLENLRYHYQQVARGPEANRCFVSYNKIDVDTLDWLLANNNVATRQAKYKIGPLISFKIHVLCVVDHKDSTAFWRLILHQDYSKSAWGYLYRCLLPQLKLENILPKGTLM
jgi:hypothetical protein